MLPRVVCLCSEWYQCNANLANASVIIAKILLSFCHSLETAFSFRSFVSLCMKTFVIVGSSPTMLQDLSGYFCSASVHAVMSFVLLFSSFWGAGCRTRSTSFWMSSCPCWHQPTRPRWRSWRRSCSSTSRASGGRTCSSSGCRRRWRGSGWSWRGLTGRGSSWKTATARRRTCWGRYVCLSAPGCVLQVAMLLKAHSSQPWRAVSVLRLLFLLPNALRIYLYPAQGQQGQVDVPGGVLQGAVAALCQDTLMPFVLPTTRECPKPKLLRKSGCLITMSIMESRSCKCWERPVKSPRPTISPAPLCSALNHVLMDHIPVVFEHFQGWWLSLPEQCFTSLSVSKVSLIPNLNLPWHILKLFSLVPRFMYMPELHVCTLIPHGVQCKSLERAVTDAANIRKTSIFLIPAWDGSQGSVSAVAGIVGTHRVWPVCEPASLPEERHCSSTSCWLLGAFTGFGAGIYTKYIYIYFFFPPSFKPIDYPGLDRSVVWKGATRTMKSSSPVLYLLGWKWYNTATIVQESILVGERDFRALSLFCR